MAAGKGLTFDQATAVAARMQEAGWDVRSVAQGLAGGFEAGIRLEWSAGVIVHAVVSTADEAVLERLEWWGGHLREGGES